MIKKKLLLLFPFIGFSAVIVLGALLFDSKRYAWISLGVALLSCIPFFLSFEKSRTGTVRLVLIAVMVTLSVAGRILFSAVPGFKPVTALIIITALAFGGEAGFMTGALTAVLSNFVFGQGPWTVFQMLAWGLIGLFAGLFAAPLKKSKILLCVYGALSGAVFSLTMDLWSTLWLDNAFTLKRYLTFVLSSSTFMLLYAVSNVVFLLLLSKPIGKKLQRIHTKYGV